jgi:hypothetical protein
MQQTMQSQGNPSQMLTTPHTFVSCTHPSQLSQKEQRFAIQSLVSGHCRRKTKRIVLPSTGTRILHFSERKGQNTTAPSLDPQDVEPKQRTLQSSLSLLTDPRRNFQICCPRPDPFEAYPIGARDCVPTAFDYFKTQRPVVRLWWLPSLHTDLGSRCPSLRAFAWTYIWREQCLPI